MDKLFLILFLVSIGCLIIGLIQPKIFSHSFKDKANRKYVGLVFGIATILFFILFGVTVPAEITKSATNTSTPSQIASQAEPS